MKVLALTPIFSSVGFDAYKFMEEHRNSLVFFNQQKFYTNCTRLHPDPPEVVCSTIDTLQLYRMFCWQLIKDNDEYQWWSDYVKHVWFLVKLKLVVDIWLMHGDRTAMMFVSSYSYKSRLPNLPLAPESAWQEAVWLPRRHRQPPARGARHGSLHGQAGQQRSGDISRLIIALVYNISIYKHIVAVSPISELCGGRASCAPPTSYTWPTSCCSTSPARFS